MRYFPLTVVEDFFVEPHLVLEFAKTAEYEPRGETNYPGVVTNHLNQEITNWVATKALSSFYDFKTTSLSWIGNSTFQKITPYGDENQFHILNRGIPHTDSAHVAGVVYLDVNPCKDAGTSFFQKKPGKDFYQRPKEFLDAVFVSLISVSLLFFRELDIKAASGNQIDLMVIFYDCILKLLFICGISHVMTFNLSKKPYTRVFL